MKINSIRPNGATLFVGFEAAGTVGRRIVDGEGGAPLGQPDLVHARCSPSAGSRRTPTRMRWSALGGFRWRSRVIPVMHGESVAAQTLRDVIEKRLGGGRWSWRRVRP